MSKFFAFFIKLLQKFAAKLILSLQKKKNVYILTMKHLGIDTK
jgi:hypothetical protein